jgi:hypothetical protein
VVRLLNLLLLLVLSSLVAVSVLRHLSYPLLWNDEAETVVYGDRILDYGYPKVHDGRNVIYELLAPLEVGVKKANDAYIGSTWGQYYFAAPGAAWARGTDDPWEKTLKVRLPFALAGLAGLVVLFLAATAGWVSSVDRRLQLASLFALLVLLSTSLVLHLREARHYPLVVLLVGSCLLVHIRRTALGRMGFRAYLAGQTVLLLLLFNVFSLPFFGLVGGFGLERLLFFFRRDEPVRLRLARLAADLAPILSSAALLVPVWFYFETFRIAAALSEAPVRFTRTEHLAALLKYLLGYSTLLPSAAAKVAALVAVRRSGAEGIPARVRIVIQVSDLFWLVFLAYVGCTSLLPFSYERYVLVLLPLLMLTLVMDGATVFAMARVGPRRARSHVLAAFLSLAWLGSVVWLLPPRWAELRLHSVELEVPYRGPLDLAVEWIRREYPHPEQLVIATNYEQPALVYYLRSRVIVGITGANLEQDLWLQPDLIIPRRWPHQRRVLYALAARGRYTAVPFDVADLPYNNIAQLARSPFVPMTHQFETPRPATASSAFTILRRVTNPEGKGP